MKFVGLVNYFQSVLAASDSDESAASFVALRDEYPCYAEAVALEMCVNATEPTDAELAICETINLRMPSRVLMSKPATIARMSQNA